MYNAMNHIIFWFISSDLCQLRSGLVHDIYTNIILQVHVKKYMPIWVLIFLYLNW